MKFNHPTDTKSIILGIASSLLAVAVWDVIKYQYKIMNYKYLKQTKDED
tara:strand:- start:3673 stop:3819 length:147 start_codon:yes stop_codon:yes gene_type:complete